MSLPLILSYALQQLQVMFRYVTLRLRKEEDQSVVK